MFDLGIKQCLPEGEAFLPAHGHGGVGHHCPRGRLGAQEALQHHAEAVGRGYRSTARNSTPTRDFFFNRLSGVETKLFRVCMSTYRFESSFTQRVAPVFIHIYIYVYVHIYIHIYVYIYIYGFVNIYIYGMYMYTQVYNNAKVDRNQFCKVTIRVWYLYM